MSFIQGLHYDIEFRYLIKNSHIYRHISGNEWSDWQVHVIYRLGLPPLSTNLLKTEHSFPQVDISGSLPLTCQGTGF